MPTAKKLPSGSWRCQVFSHYEEIKQPDGTIKKKRIYKSFTCDNPEPKGKRIAEGKAAEWAAKKETFTGKESMIFADAVESYISAKVNVLSPSTIIGYRKILKNSFNSINAYRLEDFDKKTVQSWVNTISSNASPKTVKNAYGLFSAVLSMFTDYSFKVKFPQSQSKEVYIPSDDEVKLLLRESEGEFRLALYLASFGGLRRGEICALEASDVRKNYIIVNKSMGMKEDRTWEVKTPKTVSSNRKVMLPVFLINELKKKKKGRIISMTPDHITDRFCVLRDKLELKHFRFHDLRHYYVSINHAIGVPDQYIMAQGGWSTDITMKKVYRNTIDKELNKFAELSMKHFESMQHEMQHE